MSSCRARPAAAATTRSRPRITPQTMAACSMASSRMSSLKQGGAEGGLPGGGKRQKVARHVPRPAKTGAMTIIWPGAEPGTARGRRLRATCREPPSAGWTAACPPRQLLDDLARVGDPCRAEHLKRRIHYGPTSTADCRRPGSPGSGTAPPSCDARGGQITADRHQLPEQGCPRLKMAASPPARRHVRHSTPSRHLSPHRS